MAGDADRSIYGSMIDDLIIGWSIESPGHRITIEVIDASTSALTIHRIVAAID